MELSKDELGLLLERACLRGDESRARELLAAGAPLAWLRSEAPERRERERLAGVQASECAEGETLSASYLMELSPRVLSALLEAGLSPRGKMGNGMSPVGWLVWQRGEARGGELGALLERLEALGAAGADLEAPEPGKRSPLMDAAAIDSEGAPITRLLLRLGADPNARGPGGETALRAACASSNIESAMALIEGGADERAKDDWGRAPRDFALGSRGPMRSAFISAIERRDFEKALPEAKSVKAPRM